MSAYQNTLKALKITVRDALSTGEHKLLRLSVCETRLRLLSDALAQRGPGFSKPRMRELAGAEVSKVRSVAESAEVFSWAKEAAIGRNTGRRLRRETRSSRKSGWESGAIHVRTEIYVYS